MEIREVYSLQEDSICPFYFNCIQPFPFFSNTSDARVQFEVEVIKNKPHYKIIGVFDKEILLALFLINVEPSELLIVSSLVKNERSNPVLAFQKWYKWACSITQWMNREKLTLKSVQRDVYIEQALLSYKGNLTIQSHSFQYTEELPSRLGIALGGGGAHGAYQIGVWKALRELGIDYQVVTGTSVGALNAALMIQDDFDKAEELWRKITTTDILALNQKDVSKVSMKNYFKQMRRLTQSAIMSVGVPTKPLQQILDAYVDTDKMVNSSKECFVVTVEVPSMKEKVIHVSEKNKYSVKKWLLASASFFPLMAAAKVGDHYYVDGGYRNNIPVDVALKANATHVLSVDVKGPGITKKYSVPNEKFVSYIKSAWSLGPMLLFEPERANWNMKLGYLETLKHYGVYEGFFYSFQKEESYALKKKMNQDFFNYLVQAGWTEGAALFKQSVQGMTLREKLRQGYGGRVERDSIILVALELLGKKLRITPTRCYNIREFYKIVSGRLVGKSITTNVYNNDNMLLSMNEYIELHIFNKVEKTVTVDGLLHVYLLMSNVSKKTENIQYLLSKCSPSILLQFFLVSFILDHDIKK